MLNCHCRPRESYQIQIILSSERKLTSSIPHTVFGYSMPALLGIVGANVQGKTDQPLFATHTIHICSFLFTLIVYCIAMAVDILKSSCLQDQANSPSQFWVFLAVISGSLSSVSLVSIIFPRPIGDPILSTAWIFSALAIFAYLYGRLFIHGCRRLYRDILNPFFVNIWSRFKVQNTSTEQQRSPV